MIEGLTDERSTAVTIWVDGSEMTVVAGQSVATALLAVGRRAFRGSPVSGVPRGPYCLVGVCFECLVEIDGRALQQACLIAVADGMRIKT